MICKWEIKGTRTQVGEKTSQEIDEIAGKLDDELDELFGAGSASRKEVEELLDEAEAGLRYERALAKKQGIPYIERQIAVAGTGRLSALALRKILEKKITDRGKIPVEGDYGTYEYTPKKFDEYLARTVPRVPATPDSRVRVPVVPSVSRTPTVPRTPTGRVPTTPATPRVPTIPRVTPRTPTTPRTPRIPVTPRGEVPRVPPAQIPKTPLVPALKEEGGKRRFPMDSFAWKQGFGWWVSMPPYSGTIGKDMVFTRYKPAGVPIGRTPSETVTKLGINVPKGNLLDLGIMDIQIKKKGSRIEYKRDRKQRTKLGRPVGIPPGIQYARGR